MRRLFRVATVAAGIVLLGSLAYPVQKKKRQQQDEDITQTLDLPPDPPAALTAAPARLGFLTAPLVTRGLLSQQTRNALRTLLSAAGKNRLVRIRAFVAGTGDIRRVQSIVSELMAERKLPLPVLTVVQVGGLPLEGAQVQLEATVEQRKADRAGVVFAAASAPSPHQALNELSQALRRAGARPAPLLSLVCGVTSPQLLAAAHQTAATLFPSTALLAFQVQRFPTEPSAACQAAAPLDEPVPGGVRFTPGAAALSAPQIVFSGAQLAFRFEEDDARLAFQRLERTLQASGSTLKKAVVFNIYPLSRQLAALATRVGQEFIDVAHPPPGLLIPYEGLPSIDGAFALEAIALAGPGAGN